MKNYTGDEFRAYLMKFKVDKRLYDDDKVSKWAEKMRRRYMKSVDPEGQKNNWTELTVDWEKDKDYIEYLFEKVRK